MSYRLLRFVIGKGDMGRITALLVGLVLTASPVRAAPAVQAAREAARRMSCLNHLKQLGFQCSVPVGIEGFAVWGGDGIAIGGSDYPAKGVMVFG